MVYTKNCGLPRFTAPVSFESKPSYAMFMKLGTLFLVCTSFGIQPWRVANAQTSGQVVSSHAEDFTVSYEANYKLVTHVPSSTTMALYREGVNISTVADSVNMTFKIPLQNVSVTTTTTITFLELLGERTRVKFLDQFTVDVVTSPCINYLFEQREVEVIPQNDTEEAALLNTVAATFVSSDPGADYPIILDTSSADGGTLRRAEWIKYFSVFFDKEDRANEVFDAMEERYACQREFAQGFDDTPTVAWTSYSDYPGYEGYSVSSAAYKRQYTEDAGGRFFGGDGSTYPDATEFWAALDEAGVDIIIDEAYDATPASTTLDEVLDVYDLTPNSANRFVTAENIWRQDRLLNAAGTGLDWFESALPEPDVVLEDLISVLHSESPYGTELTNDVGGRFVHERVWFRNVFAEDVELEEASCTSLAQAAEALDVRADECVILTNAPAENSASQYKPHVVWAFATVAIRSFA